MKMFTVWIFMACAIFLLSSADEPFISQVYKVDTDHPLSRIAVDNNNLFVGGKNILLDLSEDLEELQPRYEKFGPVTESYGGNCRGPLHHDTDCNIRTADNTVTVLVPNPSGYVLVCGSALHGLCSVHSKSNISNWSYLPYDPSYAHFRDSLLGSHEGNNVVIFTNQHNSTIHYFARGYEAKLGEFHSHIFSVMELKSIKSGHYMLHKPDMFSSGEGEVFMDMNISKTGKFNMEMIFGFETETNIFFIFNRSPRADTNTLEARIARINKHCPHKYLQTYVELPTACENTNEVSEKQPALSAHLHEYPGMGIFLYIAFYNQVTEGSSVCAYNVSELEKGQFRATIMDCTQALDDEVYKPEWLPYSNQLCTEYDYHQVWPTCGSYEYRGLASNTFPVKSDRIMFLENQKIVTMHVSLIVRDQNVLVGTEDGYLHKVVVSGTSGHSRRYATFDLSGNRSVPIEKSYGIDSTDQHLYFLVNNKVMKISLFSCDIHTDCESCVTSLDPLGCGWCGDHCSTQGTCTKYRWFNKTCPPEVHQISPLNGTTTGQTKVTIRGRYFNSAGGTLKVFIGGSQCLEPSHNASSITCKTTAANRTDNVSVIVQVSNDTFSMQSISNNVTFEYLTPTLEDFHPKHGPRSGFTSLTLTGMNLNIGSSLTIDVSDSQSVCELERKDNNIIVCQLTRWTSTNSGTKNSQSMPASCLGYGPVVVYIDGSVLSSNEGFCYMDDPVIDNISPLATTIGGGRIVSVVGQHFDAISMSSITIGVRDDQSQRELESNDCTMVRPELLECTYPSVATILDDAPSGVTGRLTLVLDGGIPLDKADRRIMVYNDPTFFRVTRNISLDNDEKKMVLHGLYLNLAFGVRDYNVTVHGISCPVLMLETDSLECDMSPVLANLDTYKNQVYEVMVNVGPFSMELGDLNITVYTRLAYASTPGYQNLLWVGIAFVSLFILIILCVIVKSKRRKCRRKEKRYITNHDLEGAMTFQNLMRIETDEPSSVPNNYIHIGQDEGAIGGESPELMVDLGTIDMLKKQHLLVSRDNLLLGESLGHGQFGCVYKGYLSKPGAKGEQLVAVKTILKTSAKEVDIGEFMNEALIMKDFDHPNVLSLIGVCVDKAEFPLVILPFMANGDLLAYIRDERNMPLVKELVYYGLDIADGMEYLSSIKFVHRDLAARNCMLDDEMIARVADFGLSRDIYSSHYYSSENKRKLPVKWMAPESLERGKYSSKSDVWSFGVVLWELITRGNNPYAAVDNWDMYKYLKEGRRLPKPPFCPPRLFQMMQSCWEFNPSRRPTFKDLVKEIKRLLKESEKEENSICDVTVDLESATAPS
ncbi:hepatocyte growth factor receptor-like [Argopecten irradians]|uniref:hepatocyte growth factor receptor-like n=1 Tax=Argopecten irradians TaxID=31199 RepID=UPI0037163096